jgi:Flp pilus assembly protein TadG
MGKLPAMAKFSFANVSFSPRRNRAALRRQLRRLRFERKGIAAVEFAILLPVMLAMYFTVVETTEGVTADRKTAILNRTVGDLAAQTTTIDDAERNNIFNAALSVIAPFDASPAQMSFASVVIDGAGVVKLCWSEGKNMAAPTSITIPASLKVPSTSLIVARSVYPFVPTIGHQMTGTFELGNDPYYLRPRQGKVGPSGVTQVERTGKPLC